MEFEDFIKRGEVKKREKNDILARALMMSSEKNIRFAKQIEINDENAEHIVEKCYDAVRELLEAKLSIDGYKSYSHEATILYLKKIDDFTESEIKFLENLRKLRNNIKYYGKESNSDEAKKTLTFLENISTKLKKIMNKNE